MDPFFAVKYDQIDCKQRGGDGFLVLAMQVQRWHGILSWSRSTSLHQFWIRRWTWDSFFNGCRRFKQYFVGRHPSRGNFVQGVKKLVCGWPVPIVAWITAIIFWKACQWADLAYYVSICVGSYINLMPPGRRKKRRTFTGRLCRQTLSMASESDAPVYRIHWTVRSVLAHWWKGHSTFDEFHWKTYEWVM